MNIDFTHSLVILSSSVGAIFIAAGLLLKYYPPEEINSIYGYRSKKSMLDKDRWDFAQRYSGNVMIIVGILYSLSGILTALTKLEESTGIYIGLGLMIFYVVLIGYFTEGAIKRKFDV